MTRVNPPAIVIYDRAADRYRVTGSDEVVCVSRWRSDGRDHLTGQICGRPAIKELAGIDLCGYHWRAAIDHHREHWACLAYDESNARRCRADAYQRRRELDQACASRAEALKDRAVVYYSRRADGMIKIGTTVHFKDRMKALSREHGDLQVLLTHPGSIDEEAEIHGRFSDLAIGHEWFRPGEALLSWIVSVRRHDGNARTRLPGMVSLGSVLSLIKEVRKENAA